MVGFASDIRPLFIDEDIDHMQWFCDLTSYDDVKANADDILERLRRTGAGVMPPQPRGPWPASQIDLFQSWVDGGFQP